MRGLPPRGVRERLIWERAPRRFEPATLRAASRRVRAGPPSLALLVCFFFPSPSLSLPRPVLKQLSPRNVLLGDDANCRYHRDGGSIPLANPAPRTTTVLHARLSGTRGLILSPSRCDRRRTLLEVGSTPPPPASPPPPLSAPPLTSSSADDNRRARSRMREPFQAEGYGPVHTEGDARNRSIDTASAADFT